MIDVCTAGRRGSAVEINSHPITCDTTANAASQSWADAGGVNVN